MKVLVEKSYEAMSRAAADMVAHQLREKPDSVLGLATGSTPLGLYAELVKRAERGEIDFSQVSTFNLDEYCGLPQNHEQSYRYYMRTHLFEPVGIDPARVHLPDGESPDATGECAAYEQAIRDAGGIDLQLLGIGHNGHIGFNEPADDFPVQTHLVKLAESTIQANSRLFASVDEVPREACTMGIGTIMAARSILLLADGPAKARIVAEALHGPVKPQVPASVLQLHPRVTVILDEGAAQCL